MKRCPTCQKEFPDSLRFCETDGTPLVEAADPFKTMVGGASKKDDDILQIPERDDAMKTIIIPPDIPKYDAPKPGELSMNPPSFGDLSSGSMGSAAPPSSSPFNDPPKFDAPNLAAPNSSPFGGSTDKTPPPPYKDSDSSGAQQPSFNQTPFGQSQTPFGQSSDPYNQPFQQNDWTPPPAPVAGWQNQGVGANTPFQPPVAGAGGQNQTLPIVSLVCGIISIFCCWLGFILGPVGLITGYMGRNNANTNPSIYTGSGLALAGMICGAIGTLISVGYLIVVILGISLGPH